MGLSQKIKFMKSHEIIQDLVERGASFSELSSDEIALETSIKVLEDISSEDLFLLGFRQRRLGSRSKWVISFDVLAEHTRTDPLLRNSENSRLRRRVKKLTEEKVNLLNLLEVYAGEDHPVTRPVDLFEVQETRTEKTSVLLLSDLHYAERVDPEQSLGNAYSREICKRRLSQVVQIAKKKNRLLGITRGIVCLLGDIVSGNIHDELREANETVIIEAAFEIASLLAEALKSLASELDSLVVPCVVGNHGRLDKRPRAKNGALDNFDHLVYLLVQKFVKDSKNIRVLVPRGFEIRFTVGGYRFVAVHGERVKCGQAIGGITASLSTAVSKKQNSEFKSGRPFDYLLLGHYHTTANGPNFVANGSLKGIDEYSAKEGFATEAPQQSYFIVEEGRGITEIHKIFAD